MKKIFLIIPIILFLSVSSANTLSVTFQAPDLKTKGEFTFVPGNPVKITSYDKQGKPFELEISTKLQKNNFIKLSYKLKRNGKTQGGSIFSAKNKAATLSTALSTSQKPDIKFEAVWIE